MNGEVKSFPCNQKRSGQLYMDSNSIQPKNSGWRIAAPLTTQYIRASRNRNSYYVLSKPLGQVRSIFCNATFTCRQCLRVYWPCHLCSEPKSIEIQYRLADPCMPCSSWHSRTHHYAFDFWMLDCRVGRNHRWDGLFWSGSSIILRSVWICSFFVESITPFLN